jgi:hypothetical protein
MIASRFRASRVRNYNQNGFLRLGFNLKDPVASAMFDNKGYLLMVENDVVHHQANG